MKHLRQYIRRMLAENSYFSPPQDFKDKTGIDLVTKYKLPSEFSSGKALQDWTDANEPADPSPDDISNLYGPLVDELIKLNPGLAPLRDVGEVEEWMLLPDQEISDVFPWHLKDIVIGVASEFPLADLLYYWEGSSDASWEISSQVEKQIGVRPQWMLSPETAAKSFDLQEQRIRKHIRNVLLSEMAMNKSADLPPGWAFSCKANGAHGMPQIMLVGPDGYVQHKKMKVECFFAKITTFKEDPERRGDWIDDETKKELGYDCYDLRRLDSNPPGFGPLVTDIAMEWVTSLGGILFPDRRDMSAAAQGMWDKYATREGVEQFIHPQLGTSGYRKILNTVLELEANEQVYLEMRNHDTNTQEKSKLSASF